MDRRLPALCLVLAALLLAPGCGGLLDELDNGRAEMDKHSPSAQKEKVEKAAAAAEGERTGAAASASGAAAKARQAASTWWQNARSIGSEETDENVVRCIVDGGEQYTQKQNCLMRGGRIAKRDL